MSSSASELLVERLVAAAPGIKPLYDAHLVNYDELLPHVFFGDVSRYVTQNFASRNDGSLPGECAGDAGRILKVLEDAVKAGDQEVLELVSVSFLENIDWASDEGKAVWSAMGRELRREKSLLHGE